ADGERRPQPSEPAADDADVGPDVALERRRRLVGTGLVPPPRRQPRRDRWGYAVLPDLSRRISTRTLTGTVRTAMTKIAVPMTLTCGGAPILAAPQTKSGNVTCDPELKYVTTKSSIEIAKQRSNAARIAGAIRGSVTFWKVTHSFAPRSIAASSRWR